MTNEINAFDSAQFITRYWQKKPCVIRGFCPHFADPIDEHDLAGLAMEPDVDCRIVSFNNDKWHVEQGPFVGFDAVCVGQWTLLVQGVDKYIDALSQLAERVNFIPHWRFDDIMVSFSVDNAGVGPHVDEYDVFIVQGKGRRRWQIGNPCDATTILPHPLLKQIDGFTPRIDVELETGDAVYIPPKHPHHGVALEPCMNYSIGFRAPTDAELVTGLLDEMGPSTVQTRYSDPYLETLRDTSSSPSAVSMAEINHLKKYMIELISNENSVSAILTYLSRQELGIEGSSTPVSEKALTSLLNKGYSLNRLPAVKPIHLEASALEDTFYFFIDGNDYQISCSSVVDRIFIEHFLNQPQFIVKHPTDDDQEINASQRLKPFSNTGAWRRLVCQLVNDGYWELGEPE
ncbi:MAG: cupin domain-containing protein [Pseudomonadota bacterium]